MKPATGPTIDSGARGAPGRVSQRGPVTARTPFRETLARHGLPSLHREAVTTLQVNVGWRCDLACRHCHVEAGPKRTEQMDAPTAERVLDLLAGNPNVANTAPGIPTNRCASASPWPAKGIPITWSAPGPTA